MEKLSKSEYVILGLLSKSAKSGYGLKKILNKMSVTYWSDNNAQIYPILKKLQQAKLASAKLDPDSGARNKQIYAITTKGSQTLLDWLRSENELPTYRDEYLLKLSFSQHIDDQELATQIKAYRSLLKAKAKVLKVTTQHIQEDHKGRADQKYLLMVYDQIAMVVGAKIKWCNKSLREL